MSEIENIKRRYEERNTSGKIAIYEKYFTYTHWSRAERELYAAIMLKKHCGPLAEKKVLEIGAGHGDNVFSLLRAGFLWENIFVNELLEERIDFLKTWFPEERTYEGDFLKNNIQDQTFDLIFQSTVFSSILDENVQKQIIDKVSESLRPGGFCLWYDFTFDNPKNPDVKGIKYNKILNLFKDYKTVEKRKVTLAPPVGRRVGALYSFINGLFPMLRTHILVLMQKR